MSGDGDDDYAGYELLDSGFCRKLERFGEQVFARPSAQAIWRPRLGHEEWEARADATFRRDGEDSGWTARRQLADRWEMSIDGLRFRLARTEFGHVGVFPEQRACWSWVAERIARAVAARAGQRRPEVLNLFAYSGGSTLAAARAGASVCNVDASRPMVGWARENAELNDLGDWPVRWILDDVLKFLAREARRGRRYDGVILDPPTFGRGPKGEIYKIEQAVVETINACLKVLSEEPLFLLMSSHTPGYTPTVLSNLLVDLVPAGGDVEAGEMLLTGTDDVLPLPSGAWAGWTAP